jgi:hypothetical protein
MQLGLPDNKIDKENMVPLCQKLQTVCPDSGYTLVSPPHETLVVPHPMAANFI